MWHLFVCSGSQKSDAGKDVDFTVNTAHCDWTLYIGRRFYNSCPHFRQLMCWSEARQMCIVWTVFWIIINYHNSVWWQCYPTQLTDHLSVCHVVMLNQCVSTFCVLQDFSSVTIVWMILMCSKMASKLKKSIIRWTDFICHWCKQGL